MDISRTSVGEKTRVDEADHDSITREFERISESDTVMFELHEYNDGFSETRREGFEEAFHAGIGEFAQMIPGNAKHPHPAGRPLKWLDPIASSYGSDIEDEWLSSGTSDVELEQGGPLDSALSNRSSNRSPPDWFQLYEINSNVVDEPHQVRVRIMDDRDTAGTAPPRRFQNGVDFKDIGAVTFLSIVDEDDEDDL